MAAIRTSRKRFQFDLVVVGSVEMCNLQDLDTAFASVGFVKQAAPVFVVT